VTFGEKIMKQIIRAAKIAAVIELLFVGLALLGRAIGSTDPKGGIIGYLVVGLHLPSIALAEMLTDQLWLETPLTILGAWLMWFIILLPALLLCNIRKNTPNNGVQAIGGKPPQPDP